MTQLNIGLIGAGRMGMSYARIVNESRLGQVVALVGNTPAKTDAAAQALNIPGYAHANYQALFDNHALDAVVIATPEWDHLTPTLLALEAGLPVLLEKPMTHQLEEAQKIAAASQHQLVMLCHVLRFDPRFAALRQMVQGGELGQIQHIYARRSADSATFARLAGRCHSAYWLSPHDVDLMRWITGAEVVRVRAHGIHNANQTHDGIFADLWFDNGMVARFENTWASQPLNGVWRWGQFDIEGTQGRVDITPSDQGMLVHLADGSVTSPDTVGRAEINGRLYGAFPRLVHHFMEAVLGLTDPIMTVTDGLATVRVAAAMERSIDEGRIIEMHEIP